MKELINPLFGSIPAYAGEPCGPRSRSLPGAVYPRVCGGTTTTGCRLSLQMGLSPRMRGNQGGGRSVHTYQGSIPAYAGEPLNRVKSPSERQVYPRVCGGTAVHTKHDILVRGLSPRMRGNLISFSIRSSNSGSIPAYAGEPKLLIMAAMARAVYPRVCGGTVIIGIAILLGLGLSPRMRGNQRVRPAD